MEKHLVVSVHDAAPCFSRQIKEIIAMLDSLGIDRASILVVPDYHHRSSLRSDSTFITWLKGLERRGFEIVLHGHAHIEEKKAATMEERFHSRWSTRGEGEFLSLGYDEALEKIKAGMAELRECGFDPRGFVAPAWLLSDEALEAVKDTGFLYTNSGLHFTVFTPPCRIFAPAVVLYGGANRLRRGLGVVETWLRLQFLEWSRFARIAVHPVDMDIPVLKRVVKRLLTRAMKGRIPATYEKMMELCREPDHTTAR